MKSHSYSVLLTALAFLLFSACINAMQPTPLPAALQLTGIQGQVVKAGDLPSQGHWLMIYVTPGSHFCQNMLKLLTKQDYPNLAPNSVIIVGGSIDDVKTLASKYPDLTAASWYADTGQNAFGLLKLHGLPTVLGIDQQTMEWTVNGVAPDAATFKSVLNSWLEQPSVAAKP